MNDSFHHYILMKIFSSLIFASLVCLGFAESRTWTSATDSSKTFEAEFKSSDGKSVTVLRSNRRTQTFKLNVLSEADQEWVKAEVAKSKEPVGTSGMTAEEFAETDFGKAFKKVQKLSGKKFKKQSIETVPKYFILYYSASW